MYKLGYSTVKKNKILLALSAEQTKVIGMWFWHFCPEVSYYLLHNNPLEPLYEQSVIITDKSSVLELVSLSIGVKVLIYRLSYLLLLCTFLFVTPTGLQPSV